jgi:hypothetical protein
MKNAIRFKVIDGVILDTKTSLEWQAEAHGPMTWQEAMDYAHNLGDGWRLPTIEELLTLVDYSQVNPATEFPGQDSTWYWSSSSVAYYVSCAWRVTFVNGYVNYYDKTFNNYARCVRSRPLKSRPFDDAARYTDDSDKKTDVELERIAIAAYLRRFAASDASALFADTMQNRKEAKCYDTVEAALEQAADVVERGGYWR